MYQKILVPLDGSELAECALPHVEAIAHGCQVGDVILVRVVEPFQPPRGKGYEGFFPEELKEEKRRFESEERAAAEEYLSKVAGQLSREGRGVQSQLLFGKAAESVADFAAKNGIDLIVIATHGRSGVSRWVWGSTADRILRSSCVPVMMVRAPGCIPGI